LKQVASKIGHNVNQLTMKSATWCRELLIRTNYDFFLQGANDLDYILAALGEPEVK
jgi:hypothetical protein